MHRRVARHIIILIAALLIAPDLALAQEQTIAWNPVESWTGRTNAKTERFFVAAAAWRIRWQLDAVPGFIPNLVVRVRKDGKLVQDAVISHRGSGEGIADVELGPGSYELEIGSTNGDWVLTVEEFARVSDPDGELARRAPREEVDARARRSDRRAAPSAAGAVSTQACLGEAALPGQGTFGGSVSITDGAIGYGLNAASNPDNILGAGFSAIWVYFEDTD